MSARTRTLLVALLGLGATGCQLLGWSGATAIPKVARSRPALPYEISQTELVQHLNANASRVRSWKSHDCQMTVKAPKGRMRFNATIACEAPRNFRLVASAMSGFVGADIGSNHDHCWWSMKPGKNVLYTVPHSEMNYIRNHPRMKQTMSMPFEPDWLMEVLGVTQINDEGMSMHPDTHPERVNLVSDVHTPDGQMFRRVSVVDLHAGHIIAHRIVDSGNRTVARARLLDHSLIDGARLPARIEVDWPTMDMSMTLSVKNLTVNDDLNTELWQPLPDRSRETVQLAEHLRQLDRSPTVEYRLRNLARPSERPTFGGQVQQAGASTPTDNDLPWDDAPQTKPRRRWSLWPFSRR